MKPHKITSSGHKTVTLDIPDDPTQTHLGIEAQGLYYAVPIREVVEALNAFPGVTATYEEPPRPLPSEDGTVFKDQAGMLYALIPQGHRVEPNRPWRGVGSGKLYSDDTIREMLELGGEFL
jgi:hypothetical protein